MRRSRRAISESEAQGRSVLAVMGGPAADPDSLVGSIAYARLLEKEGAGGSAVLPFLPIARQDLGLRPEALLLFERCAVNPGLLLCADELDLGELLRRRAGRLALVDTQGGELDEELRDRVVEVIDHHAPELRPGRLARFLVEPVGSACTLVAGQILQRGPEILDRRLATLLLATILLDTAALEAEAGRTTEKDRRVALELELVCGPAACRLHRECLEVRQSLPGLDSFELLRRDYKQGRCGGVRYGLSSLPLLMEQWRARDAGLEEAVDSFRLKQDLDLLLVLLFHQGESFQRQLLLCAREPGLLAGLAAFLQRSPLRLDPQAGARAGAAAEDRVPAGGRPPAQGSRLAWFRQGAADFSRKRLEPLLKGFLKAHER